MSRTERELDEGARGWAGPPKPTSVEGAAAYREVATGGEAFSEPTGTVAEARRHGEEIPEEDA